MQFGLRLDAPAAMAAVLMAVVEMLLGGIQSMPPPTHARPSQAEPGLALPAEARRSAVMTSCPPQPYCSPPARAAGQHTGAVGVRVRSPQGQCVAPLPLAVCDSEP